MIDQIDQFAELANLSLLDGTYSPRQRRNPGPVKYGFVLDPDDDRYIVAVPAQMEALIDGLKYLQQGFSLRKVARYVTGRTGRVLDHKVIEALWKKEKHLQRQRRQIAAVVGLPHVSA